MATISTYTPALSSAGIGSGLNVSSMVSGLMAVENIPMKALTSKLTKTISQISSYGSLQGSLSSLQTAAQALFGSQVQAQSASSSNSNIVTATSDGKASLGSHTIQVSKLAQQQKLASTGFADTTSAVGTGKLTIDFGSVDGSGVFTANSQAAQKITITSDNNSLAGIRDAINASGSGVTASILNDGITGNRLVFTSNNSGTANTLRISVTDENGNSPNTTGLAQLAYDPAVAGSVSEVQVAKDATLKVDGISMTKSSNTITDAIPGLTLNLKAEQAVTDTPANLNVGWDADSISKAVSDFVSAYNSTQSTIASQTSFDPTGQVAAGPLNGQFLPRSILSGIREPLIQNVYPSGKITSIGDLGVTLKNDGTLNLDKTTLQNVLKQNPTDFSAVLANVGMKMNLFLGKQLNPFSGTLVATTNSLNSQQQTIAKQQTALQQKLDATQARYTAQFGALDTILSKMQQTSTFLTQQLAALTNSSSSNNN